MSWEFKDNIPIYTQLVEKITYRIIAGEYKAGDKLPSVRDLAEEATVNPNTMQKALVELERIGLVYTVRTSGRFITEDFEMIKNMQKNLAKDEMREFLEKMHKMGLGKEYMLQIFEEVVKEIE